MKPVLYPANEKNFDSNGLGVLTDALECTVTEERNGAYELSLTYPAEGIHYQELKTERAIILAKPNPEADPQPFRIYQEETDEKGNATFSARHISYDLSGTAISPFVVESVADAMLALQTRADAPHGFTFWTDENTVARMAPTVPQTVRALLGGVEGSVLDVYGGEWEFNRFACRLHASRGTDRGVAIRYGKNLTNVKQERNIAAVFTGVHPYWANVDGALLELPEKVLNAQGSFSFSRIMPLDLSQEWQEAPTVEQLRQAAQQYMDENQIGKPKISISVSFVQLEQTEEYKDIAALERVALCDTVSVEFPKMGISAKAKCTKTVFDVLKERYSSVVLGDAVGSIAETIAARQQEAKEKPTSSAMLAAIATLTARILGAHGGAVRLLDTNKDGLPDTLYIADDPDPGKAVKVWRFNYEGWGASKTGFAGPFIMGATLEDGLLAEAVTAAKLVAGTIQSADDGETVYINLDTGEAKFKGTVYATDGEFSGELKAATGTFAGDLSAAGGTFSGTLKAAKGTFSGELSAATGTFSGTLNAAKGTFSGELKAATGTFSGTLNAAKGTFAGDLSAAGGTFSGELKAAKGTFAGELSAAKGTFAGELKAATGTFAGTLSADCITSGTIDASKITVKNLSISEMAISGKRIIYYDTWNGGNLHIGNSTYTTNTVNVANVHLCGTTVDLCCGSNSGFVYISVGNSHKIAYSVSQRCAYPTTNGNESLGTTSYRWGYVRAQYCDFSNGVGFFGTTPHAKTSVSKISTSASESAIITGLNNLIGALNNYGLV